MREVLQPRLISTKMTNFGQIKDLLIIQNNVTHESSNRMNSKVYRYILSANLERNAATLFGKNFIMQLDNEHTATREIQWKVV